MKPSTHPSSHSFGLVYDSRSDRVIYFGGFPGFVGSETGWSETWAYDYNTNHWTNMSPSSSPEARYWYAFSYDSQSDRVILFSGFIITETQRHIALNDTWAYDHDNNVWTDMKPSTAPLGRSGHALAYDSKSDRLILFGGFSPYFNRDRDDVWAYELEFEPDSHISYTNISLSLLVLIIVVALLAALLLMKRKKKRLIMKELASEEKPVPPSASDEKAVQSLSCLL
jgi:uncharacterized protein YbdZ (MbtH family)